MTLKRYMSLANKAVEAYHRQDFRQATDHYLDAFFQAPNHWTENRYFILHGGTSLLMEKYFSPSEADWHRLQKIGRDKTEPALYRSLAFLTCGILSWDAGDREAAAEYYRETLGIIAQQATTTKGKRDMNRMVTAMKEDAGPSGPTLGLVQVRQIVQDCEETVKRNLTILENPFGGYKPHGNSNNIRSDGTKIPSTSRWMAAGGPDEALKKRLAVGGNECDFCNKTLQELKTIKLECCARCKMAYYCSRDCQRHAWKNGHKQTCQTPTQIEVGDVMKLDGLEKRPELNGVLVKIMKKENGVRWSVESSITGKLMSISHERLQHIRPPK